MESNGVLCAYCWRSSNVDGRQWSRGEDWFRCMSWM
jgi:hypothetical protein